MCGLTGFWDFNGSTSREEGLKIVENMSTAIDHRGPDSSGVWMDENAGIAFGHRRLSIVDLSPAGHQPMISRSERFVIIYNGEIYNTEDVRKELIADGITFRGYSDTEVILEACEAWGVEKTAKKLIGMFVFAIWDRQKNDLQIVRDRLGIKPLYWGIYKDVLLFSSQLKSFHQFPGFKPDIDRHALVSYFRYNYVPAPVSIFKGIYKLQPGSILNMDAQKKINIIRFWDFQEIANNGVRNRFQLTAEESEEQLDILLRDAIKRRMVADVPLGAFLSGGIDSSTVVALMQAQSTRPIKTFSIGFNEDGYDEAKYAKAVAKHLGTDHHELYLKPKEALSIIPSIPTWCDEPFADASQIPTYLVSKLAREKVIVSLSGDGGDELFAGYSRYFVGQSVWSWMGKLPMWVKNIGARGIQTFPPHYWDQLTQILPKRYRSNLLGDKLYKLADVLQTKHGLEFYQSLVSQWHRPVSLVKSGFEIGNPIFGHDSEFKGNFVELMQKMDTLTYLPDDILAKVDRASMAVGLEARVPLLDHRVVEFAWRLPLNYKIRQGQGKWLLRQVLNRYVPKYFIDRPKMGFGVPIDKWLRGPLKDWAETLLAEDRLKQEGILNFEPIRQRWNEHQKGIRNWQYSLWGVLMFQSWKEHWGF